MTTRKIKRRKNYLRILERNQKEVKGAFKIEYANALVGRQAAINRGNVGSSLTQGVRESQQTSMFADFYVIESEKQNLKQA